MIGALLALDMFGSEGSAARQLFYSVATLTIFMPESRYEEFVLALLVGLEVLSMFIFLIWNFNVAHNWGAYELKGMSNLEFELKEGVNYMNAVPVA